MNKPSKNQPDKRRLSRRECFLGYVVMAATIFAFCELWLIPRQKNGHLANHKIEATQALILTDTALLNTYQQRSLASVSALATSGPVKEYVNSSRRLAQVVQHLIADDPHLVTRLIRIDSVNQGKDHRDVGFNIEIEGSFPAIGGFIERLEASHMLAQVVSVDVARNGVDLDKCVAKIGVNAHLFTEGDNE